MMHSVYRVNPVKKLLLGLCHNILKSGCRKKTSTITLFPERWLPESERKELSVAVQDRQRKDDPGSRLTDAISSTV